MKKSAGILLYRFKSGFPEVLLVHPGGPFWSQKDLGAWSIPKGEIHEDENPREAAMREFREETGVVIPGDGIALEPVRLRSGKIIHAFAMEHDFDVTQLHSNTFPLEWPPKSGRQQSFPEIDRAEWFDVETALLKLNGEQKKILEEAVMKIFRRSF